MTRGYLLARLRADITELDFTTENATIAEQQAVIVALEAARRRANDRQNEIADARSAYRDREGYSAERLAPDPGRQVAQALIAGVDASEAATASKADDELERERQALQAGARDLTRQIDTAHARIATAKAAAQAKLVPLVAELIKFETAAAVEAGQVIRDCHAVLAAIGFAANTTVATRTKDALLSGLMGAMSLIPIERELLVPDDLQAALAGIADLGAAAAGIPVVPQVHLI